MPYDNYTPRTVRAVKECPQGQKPGDVFSVTQDVADVLTHPDVACVEYADEPVAAVTPRHKPEPGRHLRRDQRAEE